MSGRKPSQRRTAVAVAPWALDAVVAVLAAVVLWPLTRFFFAQDDFILIERATQGIGAAAGEFFDGGAGQFRPLTKGLYFVLAHAAFGLNATPYHVVSVLLHVGNVLLLAAVVRRLDVPAWAARTAVVFFAFGMMNMEAVAWISCVQQLIGSIFLLVALWLGLDAAPRHKRIYLLVAFALALCSYEQTLAAPFVLVWWHATRHGPRAAWSAARTYAPLFALLALYVAFVIGYRGIPESGPYVMGVGTNVIENLRAYTSMTFAPWMIYPSYGAPPGITSSHYIWMGLIAFLLVRRRFAAILFGVGTFVMLLLPVLFTSDHVLSFHLYVPAVGAWYLAAVAVAETGALLPAARWRAVIPTAAVVVCVVFSSWALRRNMTELNEYGVPVLRSFVLRRAVFADRLWHCLRAKANPNSPSGRIVLLYKYPNLVANWRNIQTAIGKGSGVRLALNRPDLEVIFDPPEETPRDILMDEVIYFTELGACGRLEELR